MRMLVVSDIHGEHEMLQNAFTKFMMGPYDKIILLGDLADSYKRTNEDILRCFKIAFDYKQELGDRMEWLIGNHELHYMFADEMCSGYRADLAATLNPWLVENRRLLKVAYQHGNHLFTHAGVQRMWYNKYRMLIDEFEGEDLGEKLNNMILMGDSKKVLTEVGTKRGGWRGDYGGPFWCDREEMESYGPLAGYHQYVGHTPVKFREKVTKFEGDKHYNDTSVTFCDVLRNGEQFLDLEI